MTIAAFAVLAGFLVAIWFYVRWARHPETRQVAAFLIFLMVFFAIAAGGYVTVGIVLTMLNDPTLVEDPLIGLVLLIFVIVPAFMVARRQIRRPPIRPPDL